MLNDFTSSLDRFGSLGNAFLAVRAHDIGAALNFNNGDWWDSQAQHQVRSRRGSITVNATDMQFAFSTHVEGLSRPVSLEAHYSLNLSVKPNDDPHFVTDLRGLLVGRGLTVFDGEYRGSMPEYEGVFMIQAPGDLFEGQWWWVEDYPEDFVEHARKRWVSTSPPQQASRPPRGCRR